MQKRILVLLGETPSSIAARQYAFRLAQDTNAAIGRLAGIDLSRIEAPMPGAVGTTSYKVRLEEQLRKQADDARNRLHVSYEQECRIHCLTFEWLSFDGDPIGALQIATESRDLVVTGHDTAFCGNIREQLPEMLATLLLISPRPVIVCGDEASSGREILVGYDGSVPAMRAVQLFALLGLGKGQRIRVTSVDVSQELAARRADGAVSYLRNHDYDVEASPIASRVHPAEVLRIEATDRGIGTLIMGAYGHRGLREFLFGSTTRKLVENPPCALFIYH